MKVLKPSNKKPSKDVSRAERILASDLAVKGEGRTLSFDELKASFKISAEEAKLEESIRAGSSANKRGRSRTHARDNFRENIETTRGAKRDASFSKPSAFKNSATKKRPAKESRLTPDGKGNSASNLSTSLRSFGTEKSDRSGLASFGEGAGDRSNSSLESRASERLSGGSGSLKVRESGGQKSELGDQTDALGSDKSDYKQSLHRGIHLLSMREHSAQELETKLLAKADNAVAVSAVMAFLHENDYVSDARFVEAFVRSRMNKGQGPIKIRADLRSKGVSPQLIDEHVDNGSAVWFDNAEQLYTKKYGDQVIRDHKRWSKCARFLQSRGFTMDHIQSTVPQVEWG